MLSAPPASAKSASPSASACTQETIACAPEPQSRLTFIAGALSGTPASIAATRLRYMSRGSVLMTWPKTTWPIWPPSTPERSSASRAAPCAASAIGGMAARLPPKVPIAVRAPSRITMSVAMASSPRRSCAAPWCTTARSPRRSGKVPISGGSGKNSPPRRAALHCSAIDPGGIGLYRGWQSAQAGARAGSDRRAQSRSRQHLGAVPRAAGRDLHAGRHRRRGLYRARGGGFEALVLDMELAEGEAIAVADFATYRNPDLPIIAVTARGFFSDGAIFELVPNARGLLRAPLRPRGHGGADRALRRAGRRGAARGGGVGRLTLRPASRAGRAARASRSPGRPARSASGSCSRWLA